MGGYLPPLQMSVPATEQSNFLKHFSIFTVAAEFSILTFPCHKNTKTQVIFLKPCLCGKTESPPPGSHTLRWRQELKLGHKDSGHVTLPLHHPPLFNTDRKMEDLLRAAHE